MTTVLGTRDELLERIGQAFAKTPHHARLMVGVAGAPASGKSTLAEWLVERINADMPDAVPAVVLPMDGFHLDNAILDKRGDRPVKGAPQTFDAVGLHSLLQRLSAPLTQSAEAADNDHSAASDSTVYIPVFDRAMDLTRCAASAVELHHRIIVVEGNYLLLNRPVWCDLAKYFNLRVLLDIPIDILEQRLVKRWIDHGLDMPAATARALSNDIPNARVVTQESSSAHLILKGMRQ